MDMPNELINFLSSYNLDIHISSHFRFKVGGIEISELVSLKSC